jgi:putative addiction module component (TIGR02574 family)
MPLTAAPIRSLTAEELRHLTPDQIRVAAMSLPPEEREEMAEALIASLPLDPALESTIERRYEELRSGKVKGIPAEDVIKELEDLVR